VMPFEVALDVAQPRRDLSESDAHRRHGRECRRRPRDSAGPSTSRPAPG
jgi:hypothetical protein